MIKIIVLIGIETLSLLLCIYLAYELPGEEADELPVRQKVLLLLICVCAASCNAVNLTHLYYNHFVWIQTDLFLMFLFKCSKRRHRFMRGGIAILAKHLTIYMDYAVGFLFVGRGIADYTMETVLYGKKLEIISTFLLSRVMLFFAAATMIPQIKEHISDLRQTRRVLLVVDITSYLGVILLQQLFLWEIHQVYVNSFYVTVVLGIVLCIIFFIYDSTISRRERERLIDTTNKLAEDNYRNLYSEQKRLEHTAHDFKNHINLLIKYLEEEKYQEAIGYSRKLASPLEVISQRSWSGNKIMDTILNTKLLEAEQKKIRVCMEIDNMTKFPLTDYDLCVVLSNLFDNAIEACEYVEKEKKEISICIKSVGALFIIKFVNSMGRKPVKRNHRYYTIKKDKDTHGIGLESVEASIEKYQGTLLLEHTEDQFFAVVSIMVQNGMKTQGKESAEKAGEQNIKWRKRGKTDAESIRKNGIYRRSESRISGD